MIAGLDLGCNTGFSVIDEDGKRVYSETWHLGKRSGKSLLVYRDNLYFYLRRYAVHTVGYEAVKQHHRSRAAATAYGSFEGILWFVCEDLELKLVPINVVEVKKMAGVPRPEKDDMEAAVLRMFGYVTEDDNEADSLLIAECTRRKIAQEQESTTNP